MGSFKTLKLHTIMFINLLISNFYLPLLNSEITNILDFTLKKTYQLQ